MTMPANESSNFQPQKTDCRLHAAVLMGGISEERNISIQSGTCVAQALNEAGFKAEAVDISGDRLDILDDVSIDVFFVALHGRFGEDGQLQQILEDKSLVYTGSGPQASRLAFDKWASKKRFAEMGVTTPRAILFDPRRSAEETKKQILRLGERFVVKPLRQGSTIGVSIVDDPKAAFAAAEKCVEDFGDCMIEQYIAGREITVGILGNGPLPVIEIRSKTGFYDYQAKYLDEQTQFLFDTIDDAVLTAKINAAALDCFNCLGCRHFARVDLILADDNDVYALEVNTIPGFTAHSLLPKAAARAGLSMSRLCARIVEAALNGRNSPPRTVNATVKIAK